MPSTQQKAELHHTRLQNKLNYTTHGCQESRVVQFSSSMSHAMEPIPEIRKDPGPLRAEELHELRSARGPVDHVLACPALGV